MAQELDFNFPITSNELYSRLFKEHGVTSFKDACSWVQQLPYGRTKSREDFSELFTENKGTCSTKHGLLAGLAEENKQTDVELMMGIFLMNEETHAVLKRFFEDKPYTVIPEAHCFLRIHGERYDFTSKKSNLDLIIPKLVREQRIDPHQVGDWKVAIHKDYIQKWLKRKPNLNRDLETFWAEREVCIQLFSQP
jgi:hypothetical protein